MLVYGDPSFQVNAREFAQSISEPAEGANATALDPIRTSLIRCGQLEQALCDASLPDKEVDYALRLTDSAATAFVQAFGGRTGIAFARNLTSQIREHTCPDLPVTIKVPEGFAFYALFPEQYILAAQNWAKQYAPNIGHFLIIGLRSIGTTLSAVVTATLQTAGYSVERTSIRPTGNPYRREVWIDPRLLQRAAAVLIVDEGPGASGSSMAAVAKAVCEKGLRPEQIAFLPGHEGEPGPAANDEIHRLWKTIPRYFVPLSDVSWNGCSLTDLLKAKTAAMLRCDGSIEVQDLSAGAWREIAYESTAEWPAVAPQFERRKWLCSASDDRKVLWKFDGLETTTTCNGFVASSWLEGRRLTIADAENPTVIDRIAEHITNSAGSPLTVAEASAALDRLRHILLTNTRESLGDDAAKRAENLSRPMAPAVGMPRYGDGRMAPHEWVLTASGEIVKTDRTGHERDHTCIGVQSVLWDIAGAMVEWRLTGKSREHLLANLEKRHIKGRALDLTFFSAAYAAFCIGYYTFGSQSAVSDDRERCLRAVESYKNELKRCLA